MNQLVTSTQRNAESVLYDARSKISSLSHVLRSNDPPTDFELEQLASPVRDIEIEVGKFVIQTSMGMEPAFRVNVYEPLKALLGELKGAVSPIRRLPLEIISQIFCECLPYTSADGNENFWNKLDAEGEPWTLARVSSRWRQIALKDQRLWSSIDIDSWALAMDGRPEPTLPLLTTCLTRSGQHPLAIQFHDPYPSTFSSAPLLLHLARYSERWTQLALFVSSRYFPIISSLKGRLSRLRELGVYMGLSTERLDLRSLPPLDVFQVAPELRRVTVLIEAFNEDLDPSTAESIWTSPHWFSLPWEQLTSVSLDSVSPLHRFHQLLTCHLSLSANNLSVRNHSITLPCLRKLSMTRADVLDWLDLPSLEALSVDCSRVRSVTLGHISSLVSRSGCVLNTLVLREFTLDSGIDLPGLLRTCPKMVTLEIVPVKLDTLDSNDIRAFGWYLHSEDYYDGSLTYKKISTDVF